MTRVVWIGVSVGVLSLALALSADESEPVVPAEEQPPVASQPDISNPWPFDATKAAAMQAQAAAAAGVDRELVVKLADGVDMKLVLIPPGRFESGTDSKQPPRPVTLTKPFYMGVTEVTRRQLAAFCADAGFQTDAQKNKGAFAWVGEAMKKTPTANHLSPGFAQGDDHPAVCVSWDDATAFCAWLSKKTGRQVRLPTEAEWEWACRAGTSSLFPWGDKAEDGKGKVNAADLSAKKKFPRWQVFNFDDGFVYTSPAGKFQANAFGLHDMIGSVWEHCQDWFAPLPADPQIDPVGPGDQPADGFRVVRGGSWYFGPAVSNSGARSKTVPGNCDVGMGMRVVVDVK